MKYPKSILLCCLSIYLLSCKDKQQTTENYVNLNSSLLKNNYHLGEHIKLSVEPSTEMAIDSVVYFLDNKKIASSKGTEQSSYELKDLKFGPKTLTSIAYSKGREYDSSMQINILPSQANEEWTFTLVNTYPHDTKAYTQGLEFHGNQLIESTGNGVSPKTGNKGVSSIRKVNPKTGEVAQITELPSEIFGEGATVLNGKVYQLTYKHNEAYVYDMNTLKKIKTLPYFKPMEGWGLTNDGTNLYMTDGSDKMYVINPEDFSLIDTIYISSHKATVPTVNELEWVNGLIYANFYGTNIIGVIDPKTGQVLAAIEFSSLLKHLSNHPDQDVFNGIAYNSTTNTFFVTGKNWDKIFEVKIHKINE